ncbi:phosphopantothenoylcysteine decarboxylase [Haloferula rosea]|uniref:Phosphopantothenoylcysteine decarboxylase n=1 Tax=Haloferula rosea TaxID=490093 RepID=A0A934RCF7_9BACT|nr:phosphopantothenoylcysteine decarboxylase [Haloferula rosea]MBK1828577.1 phosphopantothenoylcysteine decarboxylase [Haloferula rosea]
MKVLVTAGPTREALDPVRYLTNRSSGKMGYALAQAFAEAGHETLLVSGPTELDVPSGVDLLPVESALEMFDAVRRHLFRMEAAVFCAAVADYRPAKASAQKMKKGDDSITLEFVKNPDILGSARKEFGFQGTLVGFAAETQNLETYARAKLLRKGCDLIIGNDVSKAGIGFDSDRNELLLVYPDHSESLPEDEKHHLAPRLVREIERLEATRKQSA